MTVVKEAYLLERGRLCLYNKADTHADPKRYTAKHTGAAYARPKHRCLEINLEPMAGT